MEILSERGTINDIYLEKTFYHRHRDALGNRIQEPYQKKVKREVQVVTGMLRFGHYILDAIIIGVVTSFTKIAMPSIVYLDFAHVSFNGRVLWPDPILMFITVVYYIACEAGMQTTIGKLATGTVVINQYAEKPDNASLIGRSFSRLVPFEAFSCFADRGWHDKWSNTYVVKKDEQRKLKRLLARQEGIFISDSEDLLD